MEQLINKKKNTFIMKFLKINIKKLQKQINEVYSHIKEDIEDIWEYYKINNAIIQIKNAVFQSFNFKRIKRC